MKHTFTTLALAAAFALAVPVTTEAAPRKDKHKSSQVSKQRHHSGGGQVMASRGGSRYPGRAVLTSGPRYGYRGPVAAGPGYRRGPVLAARPSPYYYGPRRPLLWFLFGL